MGSSKGTGESDRVIKYSDYEPSDAPVAVIAGKLVELDHHALHVLSVNAMALAVAMPSTTPDGARSEPAVAQ